MATGVDAATAVEGRVPGDHDIFKCQVSTASDSPTIFTADHRTTGDRQVADVHRHSTKDLENPLQAVCVDHGLTSTLSEDPQILPDIQIAGRRLVFAGSGKAQREGPRWQGNCPCTSQIVRLLQCRPQRDLLAGKAEVCIHDAVSQRCRVHKVLCAVDLDNRVGHPALNSVQHEWLAVGDPNDTRTVRLQRQVICPVYCRHIGQDHFVLTVRKDRQRDFAEVQQQPIPTQLKICDIQPRHSGRRPGGRIGEIDCHCRNRRDSRIGRHVDNICRRTGVPLDPGIGGIDGNGIAGSIEDARAGGVECQQVVPVLGRGTREINRVAPRRDLDYRQRADVDRQRVAGQREIVDIHACHIFAKGGRNKPNTSDSRIGIYVQDIRRGRRGINGRLLPGVDRVDHQVASGFVDNARAARSQLQNVGAVEIGDIPEVDREPFEKRLTPLRQHGHTISGQVDRHSITGQREVRDIHCCPVDRFIKNHVDDVRIGRARIWCDVENVRRRRGRVHPPAHRHIVRQCIAGQVHDPAPQGLHRQFVVALRVSHPTNRQVDGVLRCRDRRHTQGVQRDVHPISQKRQVGNVDTSHILAEIYCHQAGVRISGSRNCGKRGRRSGDVCGPTHRLFFGNVAGRVSDRGPRIGFQQLQFIGAGRTCLEVQVQGVLLRRHGHHRQFSETHHNTVPGQLEVLDVHAADRFVEIQRDHTDGGVLNGRRNRHECAHRALLVSNPAVLSSDVQRVSGAVNHLGHSIPQQVDRRRALVVGQDGQRVFAIATCHQPPLGQHRHRARRSDQGIDATAGIVVNGQRNHRSLLVGARKFDVYRKTGQRAAGNDHITGVERGHTVLECRPHHCRTGVEGDGCR